MSEETYDLEEVRQQVPVWIEKLESSCYDQTAGVLCDEAGYCCFGVANMAIFGESFVPGEDGWTDSTGDIQMLSDEKLSLLDMLGMASEDDIEAFEAAIRHHHDQPTTDHLLESLLTDEKGRNINPRRYTVLAALNDASVPFAEIARYIRASGWFSPLIDTPDEEQP